MSDAVLTGLEDFEYDERRHTSRNHDGTNDKKISVLKILVLILCVLLLGEALLYTLVIPCLAPAKVQVSGLQTLSMDQVMGVLGKMSSKTWMQFDVTEAGSLLSTIPSIQDASIDKHFPDRVVIKISERIPVAQTIVTVGNRAMPVQIDEKGVLFAAVAPDAVTDTSVPLITGIPVERMQDGMYVPPKYRTLIEQVASIRDSSQKYFAAISEIQVVPKQYGNFELILYPIHSRVKVLTDRSLNEDALKYMMVVLDVVNSIEPDVSEIDLRYGSVSYRRR